jgi:hypothetical protein
MDLIPEGTELGRLEYVETYEFYDFPRLFSVRNGVGTVFLGLSIEDDAESHRWLYLPMSKERFQVVRSGEMLLRNAFLLAEDAYVFDVRMRMGELAEVQRQLCQTLSDEWLPDADVSIELDTATSQPIDAFNAADLAAHAHRETLNLVITPSGRHLPQAPARKLGRLFGVLQEFLDAVGQKVGSVPTLRGSIAKELRDQTAMDFVRVFPGSMGLQFKAATPSDLFDDSLIGRSLGELLQLMSVGADEDLLSNKLFDMKGRAASKYRDFLEATQGLDTDLKVEWGSPMAGRGGSISLTKTQISATLAVVNKITTDMGEDVEVPCVLVGANIRTMRYEIMSDANEKFSGKISASAGPDVAHARLNERYTAILKKLTEVFASTGDETVRWILIELKPR